MWGWSSYYSSANKMVRMRRVFCASPGLASRTRARGHNVNFPEQPDAVARVEGTEVVLAYGSLSGVKSEKSRTMARARAIEVPATCCDTARDNELAARIERVRRDIAGELLVRASFKLRIRSVVVDSSVMMGK